MLTAPVQVKPGQWSFGALSSDGPLTTDVVSLLSRSGGSNAAA
jgi:hypothetical protein